MTVAMQLQTHLLKFWSRFEVLEFVAAQDDLFGNFAVRVVPVLDLEPPVASLRDEFGSFHRLFWVLQIA